VKKIFIASGERERERKKINPREKELDSWDDPILMCFWDPQFQFLTRSRKVDSSRPVSLY